MDALSEARRRNDRVPGSPEVGVALPVMVYPVQW